jgi:hypothetical protein
MYPQQPPSQMMPSPSCPPGCQPSYSGY